MMEIVKSKINFVCTLVILSSILLLCTGKDEGKAKSDNAEKLKKKDIRDYNDADMERLFDQWEESDEDELEEDELPEWKREPPKIDMSQIDSSDPAELLKASKKGRTLMMFATVSGDPTEEESDKITMLWQSSLFNAHVEVQRYVVGSNRVLFMLNDGSKAWEVKDFLVKQERCQEVTIEGQNFPGAASTKDGTASNSIKKGKAKSSKSEL